MKMQSYKYPQILLTFLLVFVACFPSLAARNVKMSLSTRGPIAVGSKFSVDIVVTDINATPKISGSTNVPGAKVLYFTDTESSSSMTYINGHQESSSYTRYTLLLQATTPGTHTFGPINVGGVKSNAIKFTVGKGSATQATSGQTSNTNSSSSSGSPSFIGTGNGNLFLRASVSKTTAYEQEAIVYTVKLYSTYSNIRFVGATASPKFEGFVVEESKDISQQLTFENYNGKQYASAVIARYIIFPQMPGSLKVLGNTYTVAVDEREYYNDPYFGRISTGRPLQLNVKPNDLSINVKALPKPTPANFSGGVGSFSISARIQNLDWKTNTPSSVQYTITGSGNLKYIKLPELNNIYPKEIEVFSPETSVNASVKGSNVSGSSTFDYSLVPLETGDFKIPAIPLVYFDPATSEYRTIYSREFNVKVGKGSSSAKSQTNTHVRFSPDLMQVNKLDKNQFIAIRTLGYWLVYILLIIVLLTVYLIYKARIKENSDIVSLKSRKAGKVAAKRLKNAFIYLKANDTERFYDEILASLWGYASDKLKIPTSDLSRDNITERLESEGVSAELCMRFIAVVDDAEFAKYSPRSGGESMQNVYNDAAQTLESIESSIKARKK